jgi:peptidoglycan/xylan/chitin deacetylase (PgdA/CDA1 family)
MSAFVFRGQDSPTWLSRGEFGARVGIIRVLQLLADHHIQATFFVPGYTADSFPDRVRAIRDAAHEIGNHGYLHEPPAQAGGDPEQERAVLRKANDALKRVAGVIPTGYRSPSWDLSPHSVRLLREEGFVYDSSLMADDFHPYLCREGDEINPEGGYRMGVETDLIELPVSWILDDFPYFELRPGDSIMASAEHVFEVWRDEFDYAYEHAHGGIFTLTMHPYVIGRGHRMAMLDRLIHRMKSRSGVHFASMGEVAAAAKVRLTAVPSSDRPS